MNLEKAQLGQGDGITTIIERRAKGERATAIIKPPRCGKTNIIRVASVEMQKLGLVCCTLALSVNEFLAGQMVDVNEWQKAARVFELSDVKYRRITTVPDTPLPNGEIFLSSTIHLVVINEGAFCDWASEMMHLSGLPVHVPFDEAHMGSLRNRWGDILGSLMDLGAYLTYFTGSPRRHDDVRIRGLEYREGEWLADRDRYRVRPHQDPTKVWIDHLKERSRAVDVVGHSTTTLEEAWSANIICHINREPVDVVLDVKQNGQIEQKRLSEIAGYVARQALAESVRKPNVIRDVVEILVSELSRYRVQLRDAAAIVFCGNDGYDYHDDESDPTNRHAKDIKKAIQRRDPSLSIKIATTAEDNGAATLEAFKAGSGDVLIVKNMASLGVSIPRLKIGADLSTTRTYSGYLQRMMRSATPHAGLFVCTWITPDDVLSREYWEDIVVRGGGQAKSKSLELIDSYEKKKEKRLDDPTAFYPVATTDANFQDSLNNEGRVGEKDAVHRFMNAFPELLNRNTYASIAVRLRDAGLTVEPRPDPGIENIGLAIQWIKDDINHDLQELAKRRIMTTGYRADEYEIIITDLWRTLYRTVGVVIGTRLEDIEDLVLLRRMWAVTRRWVLER